MENSFIKCLKGAINVSERDADNDVQLLVSETDGNGQGADAYAAVYVDVDRAKRLIAALRQAFDLE